VEIAKSRSPCASFSFLRPNSTSVRPTGGS
jgi:hypothetical protein